MFVIYGKYKNEKQFKNFVKILEAIVAYHKADEALKSIEL